MASSASAEAPAAAAAACWPPIRWSSQAACTRRATRLGDQPVSSEVRAGAARARGRGARLALRAIVDRAVEEQDDRMEGPSSSSADARESSADGVSTAVSPMTTRRVGCEEV